MAEPRAATETRPPAAPRRRGLRIGLALLLVGKLVLVGLWRYETAAGASGGAASGAETAAGGGRFSGAPTAAATTVAAAGGDARRGGEVKPPDVRALLETVARRQSELDARERELGAREERLQLFEKDVTAKIASLEEIEKRLQARAKTASAAVDAAAESLAKVYGAMKPAEAAPILERLDEPTVLTIFGRMKEKQIGEILPLMSRDKAIALTRSLAERR